MLNNTCVIPDDCPCPDCDPLPDNCSVITTPSPDEQCGCDTCEGKICLSYIPSARDIYSLKHEAQGHVVPEGRML